jgi:hypothetical protein
VRHHPPPGCIEGRPSEVGSSAAPVLDAKPRDADHLTQACRDERRIESEGTRRNGGIQILTPRSTAFQGRFDAAEHPADGIGPLGAWEFRGDEIEARLQRRPALRTRMRGTCMSAYASRRWPGDVDGRSDWT